MIKISVVICTFNKKDYLIATLNSFLNCKYKFDEFEIVISDDGSEIDLKSVLNTKDYPFKIVIVRQTHVGRAKSRNVAIEAAKGNIIVFNDDDTLVTPDFLNQHYDYHKENEKVVIIGQRKQAYMRTVDVPKIKESDIATLISYLSKHAKLDIYSFCTNLVFEKIGISSHWIGGVTGNMSVKKEHLINCGKFDTNFKGWGFEDIELSYRLALNGLKFLYTSNAVNYHLEHARDRKQMIKEMYLNIEYFYTKYAQSEEIRLFWDFFRGKIGLKELDAKTYKELGFMKEDVYFRLFKKSNLYSLI